MSLKTWAANGWLRTHQSSTEEVQDLLAIVDRDLDDAGNTELSDDWRFGIAYNAALKLCTILLHVSGYRPEKNLAHYRTLQALPLILGNDRKSDADYLETCRVKRNKAEYDYVGAATGSEANELIQFTTSLREDVMAWLREHHPAFLQPRQTGPRHSKRDKPR